jgi:hypothetical protein
MLNTVTTGYTRQEYGERFNTFNATVMNSLTRSVGTFSLSGNYYLAYLRVRSALSYSSISNTAGLVLSGMLPRRIQSQTDIRYRDDRFPGEATSYRNQRTMSFAQRFNSSWVYRIPFSIGLSVSANWYLANVRGRTYGWIANFTSPSFFVKRLGSEYTYSRTFDPYYQREIVEHGASLAYQWRALSFGLRLRYATFPVRVREFWFNVSRPF